MMGERSIVAGYALRVTLLEKGWTHDYAPAGIVFTSDEDARRWGTGFQRALGAEYRCALPRGGEVVLDCSNPARAINPRADLFGAENV
jgi:hypothetical protein